MKFKAIMILTILSIFASGVNAKSENNDIVFNLKTNTNKAINLTISNQQWNFKPYKNKVIILDFFATWCPPCKRSIPHLNSLREKFGKDLEIIGLDIGNRDGSINSTEALSLFINKYKIKYPVTKGDVNNQIFMGLSTLNPMGSIPFMVLFNKKGQFVKPYIGMVNEKQLENDIKNLLK